MAFSPNPFDHVATLDTTGIGTKSVTTGIPAGNNDVGVGVDQGNTSVTSVCPAFTDSTLPADAANRVLPGQPRSPYLSWR